uniref:Bestrophin homolog n=2 Tax=Ditylum brightwellii TaxID=49249 RepID=A0A7S4R163_9STRA
MAREQDPLLSAEEGKNYTTPQESARPQPTVRFNIKFNESYSEVQVPKAKPIRRVHFHGSSHISVLFQMYGSVWPAVIPYCLFNVLLTYAVFITNRYTDINLSIGDSGHSFMSMLIAFLIVTRAKLAYGRYMEARHYLQNVYRVSRDLIQNMCVMTQHSRSEGAKKWRRDVAYRTIVLLRVTMAAIEFNSNEEESAWDTVPESIRSSRTKSVMTSRTSLERQLSVLAHGSRTRSDENFRAPLVLAHALRNEILSQRSGDRIKTRRADTKTPMHPNEERVLYRYVTEFITAFHGLKKLVTTPFPFPLVQMGRTFLFVYTYTLPFALAHSMHHPLGAMLMIFFITYGYLGLEYVAMELDDPFGDDPNDFDDLGLARVRSFLVC